MESGVALAVASGVEGVELEHPKFELSARSNEFRMPQNDPAKGP